MKADTEFTAALLGASCVGDPRNHPAIDALSRGLVTRSAIRSWASALAGVAEAFPRVVASILAICDSVAVRTSLLANLLEEEGVVSFSKDGMIVDPLRRHTHMARKFAIAAGANEDSLGPAPPSRWFDVAIRRGDWIAAYAYSAIGIEANVPATFALFLRPLVEVYGFDPVDLEFLQEHITADQRHGSEAAELMSVVIRTDDERQRAIEGARRGAVAWWTFHRSHLTTAAAQLREPQSAH